MTRWIQANAHARASPADPKTDTKLVVEGVEKDQRQTNDNEEEKDNTNAANYVDTFKKYCRTNTRADACSTFILAKNVRKIKF